MNNPFFILGNPRSGTSLFRLMLNSHPTITVPPESGFLQWWYEKYKNWNVTHSINYQKVESYVSDIFTSKKIEDWKLDRVKIIDAVLKNKPKNYAELSMHIYKNYGSAYSNINLIGDKNNYYIHHLQTINSIYPTSKYIHIIRDGRDVACSYIKLNELDTNSTYKPNLTTDIEEIATEWVQNVKRIDGFINTKPHLCIRYEDLIENTEKVLRLVCDFLKVNYDANMLNYYMPHMNDEPISTRDWKMKTLEPVDKLNIKKYLSILNPEEILKFNTVGMQLLKKYEYEL